MEEEIAVTFKVTSFDPKTSEIVYIYTVPHATGESGYGGRAKIGEAIEVMKSELQGN